MVKRFNNSKYIILLWWFYVVPLCPFKYNVINDNDRYWFITMEVKMGKKKKLDIAVNRIVFGICMLGTYSLIMFFVLFAHTFEYTPIIMFLLGISMLLNFISITQYNNLF